MRFESRKRVKMKLTPLPDTPSCIWSPYLGGKVGEKAVGKRKREKRRKGKDTKRRKKGKVKPLSKNYGYGFFYPLSSKKNYVKS